MKRRSIFASFLSLALAAVLLVGCANQQKPAQQAIADVEAALAAAGADATKYIPDKVQAVEAQLANLKVMYDAKDYKGAIAAAPAALAAAQALPTEAAAVRQAAMDAYATEWAALSATVPAALAAVDSRASILAKAKKLPEGMTAEQLAAVQVGLVEANDLWSRASAAQAAGDLEQAVALANSTKERADGLLLALGMGAG
jgi:enamine deaminase RidA (YjgF/YER057c/UK114 family)